MLLHSYGGAVGAEAVRDLSASERATKGLSGGVIHLIYMCGFMLQVGESVGSASLPRPVPEPIAFDESTDTTFLCEPPETLFYNDLKPELAAEMTSLLVRHSAVGAYDEVTYAGWQYIPTTYLRTLNDQVLFLDWQDRMIQAVRDKGVHIRVETFRSSHSPFLSMPGEMVKAVERVCELKKDYAS